MFLKQSKAKKNEENSRKGENENEKNSQKSLDKASKKTTTNKQEVFTRQKKWNPLSMQRLCWSTDVCLSGKNVPRQTA